MYFNNFHSDFWYMGGGGVEHPLQLNVYFQPRLATNRVNRFFFDPVGLMYWLTRCIEQMKKKEGWICISLPCYWFLMKNEIFSNQFYKIIIGIWILNELNEFISDLLLILICNTTSEENLSHIVGLFLANMPN